METESQNHLFFGLNLFSGLVVFQFFSDCLSRAPQLVMENPTYVKKIVFPLSILPWIVVSGATFNFITSIFVLIFVHFILIGPPPLTIFMLPMIYVPLVLITVSAVWIVSALGVFIRDLGQAIGVIITITLFTTPIFYSESIVPEKFRGYLHLNPLTTLVKESRNIIMIGAYPDIYSLFLLTALSVLCAWLGLSFFNKMKAGFVDVL